jgi:hypothetical protein
MKSLAVVLLVVLAVGGLALGAAAQTSAPPAGTQAPSSSSDSTSGTGSLATPGGGAKGQLDVDRKSPQVLPAPGSRSSDDGSALPRAAVERTTIFGLSPTAAVVIAAALLVVVILAIVAMTRSGDTYIDTDRRF